MKLLFYINVIIYIAIISCYMSVTYTFYGLIGQFFFGIFQLIVGFYLLTVCYNFDQKIRSFIKYYWLMIAIYIPLIVGFILLVANSIISSYTNLFSIGIMIVVPMLIAAYLINILYAIQKS